VFSELNSGTAFALDGHLITCDNCVSYENARGFVVSLAAPGTFADGPIILKGSKSEEDNSIRLWISNRHNVDVIGFLAWASPNNLPTGIRIDGSSHINIIGGSLINVRDVGIDFNTGASS
jgi:hypothetical protein